MHKGDASHKLNNVIEIFLNEAISHKSATTMELNIAPDKTIKELQERFHGFFPYLKIEFFRKPHVDGVASPKSDLVSPNILLGNLSSRITKGTISLSPHISVTTLEKTFRQEYGLNVQVFRSSNNLWIETSLTDHWSLERQNNEGEEISKMHQGK